jgi:hypothetical protein
LPIEISNLFIILIALSLRSAEEQYLETRARRTAGERGNLFIRPMIDYPPRFSRSIVTRFVQIDLDFVPNSRHRTHLEILRTTLASAREFIFENIAPLHTAPHWDRRSLVAALIQPVLRAALF